MSTELTFEDYARLMRAFEHNCTEQEIQQGWDRYCFEQATRNVRKA